MRKRVGWLSRHVESSAVLGAILLAVFFTAGTKGLWISNVPNILAFTALIGIIAIGQAVLMISGEFDLSVGSVFAFAGVAFISLMDLGAGVFVSFLGAMILCGAIGAVNGLVTLRFKVPSMIVTLGAMFAYRGVVYIMTRGLGLHIPHDARESLLVRLLGGAPLGFSSSILLLGLITAVFIVVLSMTRYGNHVFAVGADARSAQSCGVSPVKTKLIAFINCSVLAGFTGIMVTCQESTVYASSGKNVELESIVAAVVGGCALSGGIGSVWGAVLGAFIMSSLRGGLLMMGAPSYWYISFVGVILIVFMVLSRQTGGLYGMSGQNGKD
jgi:simple sugar transport system permease protein/ribose transport system permease protein